MKHLLFFLFLLPALIQAQADADKILGTWEPSNGRSRIKITRYGDKFGGKIVWMIEPKNADGTLRLDSKNPDKVKQKQSILNSNNLLGFTYAGNKEYDGGTIYDPNNGKTYKCTMTLADENTLKVRGYIGVTLIGRTDTWKRVSE